MLEYTYTALIVDDSRLVREKLKEDLVAEGCGSPLEAESAEMAVQMIKAVAPDVILLDLTLPDADGIALLREWRAMEALIGTSILVITAAEEEQRIEACFAAGADDFIRKPWSRAGLASRIRAHVQRRRSEAELRRLQAVFNMTQSIAQIGGWEIDLLTNRMLWTDEMYRIVGMPFGYQPDLESTYACYPEDMRSRVRGMVEDAMRTGEAFEFESPFFTASGKRIWVYVMGRAEVVSGNPVKLFGTFQNITQRKRAEQDRDRLFELSLDMLCIAGFDGFLKQVNPAWERTLGWSEEELLSRPWLDFVYEEDRSATVAALASLKDNKPVVGFENRYYAKDGEIRWISWNSFPMPSEELAYGVARDITEHKAYQERLAYDASHDLLTDLYNRAYLLDELQHQVAFARRYRRPLTFCLCDLDHFKIVNDTHGHQTGDTVLERFAGILKKCVRETDLVGRYGGEEFAIAFPNTDLGGGVLCAERALAMMQQESFVSASGETFFVTATFGLAQWTPEMADESDLIAQADIAMYSGKAAGRNRVITYRPDMSLPGGSGGNG